MLGGVRRPARLLYFDGLGLVSDREGKKCRGRRAGGIGIADYKVPLVVKDGPLIPRPMDQPSHSGDEFVPPLTLRERLGLVPFLAKMRELSRCPLLCFGIYDNP